MPSLTIKVVNFIESIHAAIHKSSVKHTAQLYVRTHEHCTQ